MSTVSSNKILVETIAQIINQVVADAIDTRATSTALALNKFVVVERTTQFGLTQIRKPVRGLLRQVSTALEGVTPSKLEDSKILQGIDMKLKDEYQVSLQDVEQELKQINTIANLFSTGTNIVDQIANKWSAFQADQRNTISQIIANLIDRCVNALAEKLIKQMQYIQAGLIRGSFNLTTESGQVIPYTSTIIDGATASPLWSNSASATTIQDLWDLRDALQADSANNKASLVNGSTFMSQKSFNALKSTDEWVNLLGSANISPKIAGFQVFQDAFTNLQLGNLLISEAGHGYIDSAGQLQSFMPEDYVYQASWTDNRSLDAQPPFVIKYTGEASPLLSGLVDTVVSTNVDGATILLRREVVKGQPRTIIEMIVNAQIHQYLPVAKLKVL